MEPEKKEGHHYKHTHHSHHQPKKPSSNIFSLWNIFIVLVIALGIITIVNIAFTFNLNQAIKKNVAEAEEAARPAKIELIIIGNSKCPDCFDISTILGNIKNLNIEIENERTVEFDSTEGKKFVSKYNIEKIPTVIITGEIDKVNVQGLAKQDDALTLKQINPPYTNPATGKIEGKVILYLIQDPQCGKCNDER